MVRGAFGRSGCDSRVARSFHPGTGRATHARFHWQGGLNSKHLAERQGVCSSSCAGGVCSHGCAAQPTASCALPACGGPLPAAHGSQVREPGCNKGACGANSSRDAHLLCG